MKVKQNPHDVVVLEFSGLVNLKSLRGWIQNTYPLHCKLHRHFALITDADNCSIYFLQQ